MNFKVSAWAAIIAAVVIIPFFILGMLLSLKPDSKALFWISVVATIGSILIVLPIVFGYIRIARISKSKFLEIMMYISLSLMIILNLTSLFDFIKQNSIFLLILVSMTGISGMIVGVALLKLKNKLGKILTAVGIMNIIHGFSMATIVFFFLEPFIGIAISILEAVLFFKASKKFDK